MNIFERFLKLIIILQKRWSTVFCGIVSRAMTLEVLSTGVAGNYNGALQVVYIYIYPNCLFILKFIC